MQLYDHAMENTQCSLCIARAVSDVCEDLWYIHGVLDSIMKVFYSYCKCKYWMDIVNLLVVSF